MLATGRLQLESSNLDLAAKLLLPVVVSHIDAMNPSIVVQVANATKNVSMYIGLLNTRGVRTVYHGSLVPLTIAAIAAIPTFESPSRGGDIRSILRGRLDN